MIILFPSEPFSPKEVDSSFKSEYEAAKLVGFEVHLFDHDEFVKNGEFKSSLLKKDILPKERERLILRSWMLKDEQYKAMFSKLIWLSYELFNMPDQYTNCHHFPEYYTFIKPFTSKSIWGPVWHKEVLELTRKYLGDNDLIIKDYVKSEKGNPDLFILKKELSIDEFQERIEKFVEARGKLFNKGLVFKVVEKLKKYEEQTNEWRMFFLNKKLVTCSLNSENLIEVKNPSKEMITICESITRKWIDSCFFTIDIAEKEDGSWMILEMGDGQVSGLAAQEEPIKFYNLMYNQLNEVEVTNKI